MIKHVAGIAEIVEDLDWAVAFYRDKLGLSIEGDPDDGYVSVIIEGVLHFGLWSRSAAARTVFGESGRSLEIPLGFTVGFEVDEAAGFEIRLREAEVGVIQETRQEPWGQTTARFLLPSGALGEISETPWARALTQNVQAREAE